MNTREKILKGAKDYLLKHGQAGFTIRAIATEADVNKGLVHHYFGSKENLVLELIDYVAILPFEKIKEIISNGPKEEVKKAIVKIFLQNSELVNMAFEFMYFARHSDKIKEKLRNIARERREFLADYFGIKDSQEKYALNAAIFGIIAFSRVETSVDIEASMTKLFERFNVG